MFRIERELEVTNKKHPIWIIPIGDIHNGSPNCNWKKVAELVKWIKDTPQCYVIGMGDYLDCIMSKDERYDVMNNHGSIDQARQEMRGLLYPIKDKIICLLTGNHEYKLCQWGIGDPTNWLCQELGVPYAGFSTFIKLKVPHKPYHAAPLYIYAHHGWSAGRKSGSVINNIEDLRANWEADVYLVGHSHHLQATRRARVGWFGTQRLTFVNTGSFLETCSWDTTSYSERAGYPPTKLGVIKLMWEWQKGDVHTRE